MSIRGLGAAIGAGGILAAAGFVAPALAETVAEPHPWQLGLQESLSPVMHKIASFHTLLLVIITLITLFVLALMIYVCVKFRADNNPTPSKTTHNSLVEVVWTVAPILILIMIAVPSFRLLYFIETVPPGHNVTVKAIGNQWFWTYEYPDHDEELIYDSLMLEDDEAEAAGKPRLLGVDNPLVVPANKVVKVLVTAEDVLHNFAMPALGLKMDAVPGRLNETWFLAEKEGVYYGQCSELCGGRHAFMPIEIVAVSEADYQAWLAKAAEDVDEANQLLASYYGDGATRLASSATAN